jgi:hypothetical protein
MDGLGTYGGHPGGILARGSGMRVVPRKQRRCHRESATVTPCVFQGNHGIRACCQGCISRPSHRPESLVLALLGA